MKRVPNSSSNPPRRASRLRKETAEASNTKWANNTNPKSPARRPAPTRAEKRGSNSSGFSSLSCCILIGTGCIIVALLASFTFVIQLKNRGASSRTPSILEAPSLSSATGLRRQRQQSQQQQLKDLQNSAADVVKQQDVIQAHAVEMEQQQQQQRHAPKTIHKNESNVIDMRQLNYELKFDNPDGGAWKQGWDVQPEGDGPLTVFVIPHSHCDPGWIKTFDEYFQTQTKQILTTVINALKKDKRRKFIWAEISYFEWWWREQTHEMRLVVRELIKEGQFEFVTGGWVQPDEANSELYAMEIQLQEGHDWLRATFGDEVIPKYGWAIDPFGYSPTMAWLLQKYGFRAMLIQRVHYAVKKELAKRKHLEFYWRQTWDDGPDGSGEHDIFTHVMPFFSYDVPHTCGPDPSVCCQFDFRRLQPSNVRSMAGLSYTSCPWGKHPQEITDDNVKERAMLLWEQYRKKGALYRSNTVLVPLGDDFCYQADWEAEAQYNNYQKMFEYINANVPGAKIQFGTLSEYFKTVMGSFETPILKGSFFTYADVNQDYWSGYYTSRVFDKALDRQLERALHAAEAMGGKRNELQGPRRALSLFQHHDGVTGTAKNHVVEDYAKRMFDAIGAVNTWMIHHMQKMGSSIINSVASGGAELQPCLKSSGPRVVPQNMCKPGDVLLFNPLETSQSCGNIVISGRSFAVGTLPCDDVTGHLETTATQLEFDRSTGMLLKPIREQWMVWSIHQGGAYLFVPGSLGSFDMSQVEILHDGYVVKTPSWSRTIYERKVPSEFGSASTVLDFVYETDLKANNNEWIVRFSSNISNGGYFHTDLNGFNFDTHRFRSDLPVQSQVFPMPTLASIEDANTRLTVLSEHAQGTASLKDGSIDVWLDRRLAQDDDRGLGQGVQDNTLTRTRFRVLLEADRYTPSGDKGEFSISSLAQRMWDELQHPLQMFGKM